MVPRPSTGRERNNDYSAVGTAGRRTGVTLPQARLDENGLEEITGLFSSPVKPSQAKQNTSTSGNDEQNSTSEASEDMSGMDSSGLTPTQTLSARRSLGAPALPPPRSASPRKSGISGTARRSNGIDILSPAKADQGTSAEDHENSPSPTPIRVKPRRFVPSPDKRPLEEIVPNGVAMTPKQTKEVEDSNEQHAPGDKEAIRSERKNSTNQAQNREPATNRRLDEWVQHDDSVQNPMGDEEMEEFLSGIDNAIQDASPIPKPAPEVAQKQSEKVVESVEAAQTPDLHEAQAPQRKKSRKRKSEEVEQEPVETSSKRPGKRPRGTKAEVSKAKGKQKAASVISRESSTNPAAAQAGLQLMPARLPGLTKDPNTHLSQRQQAELDQIIEKVKARPGKLKTLYVLKREKSKKSGVDDIRSGRAIVKPLAYWSTEQCVYPEGAAGGLELGSRIPLSSVTEINRDKKNKVCDQNSDSDDVEDPHAEPWEREIGVFRGETNVWSQQSQTTTEEFEETDLAFHPSSMLATPVTGSPGFAFAKLVGKPFFGNGILDLAPGAMKRPKNSRSMHMCFFVFKGRVTVRVGQGLGIEGEFERFSVGKGGVFQVPRGNKYSIENELEKPARIFFSQGSETVPEG